MSLALWHWHIEVSSKCTLACPRCARTEVPDTLVNTQLHLDFFKKNFTKKFIKDHVEKITFCGDDGDPIYAQDLIPIIEYFKSVKPVSIVIVTNGSYKDSNWWANLGEILTDIDQVHFSLDGYDQESNEQYRVNSDWDSIMRGVKTLRAISDCYMSWDAIAFKFNEDKLQDMQVLAKQLGFDQFQLTKSTKFGIVYENYGPNDVLQPKEELVSSSHRFERIITNLSTRVVKEPWLATNIRLFEKVETIDDKIVPMCHIGNKGMYINSRGEFYPCCWVANRYGHNSKWFDFGKSHNLHDVLLSDVVKNSIWKKEFTNGSYECSTKCIKSRVTKNYATEW